MFGPRVGELDSKEHSVGRGLAASRRWPRDSRRLTSVATWRWRCSLACGLAGRGHAFASEVRVIEIRALTCQRRSLLAVGAVCNLARRWRRRCFAFCGRQFGQPFLVRGCSPTHFLSFQPCFLLFQDLSLRRTRIRSWKLLWTLFGLWLWLLASNLFGGAVLEAPLAP